MTNNDFGKLPFFWNYSLYSIFFSFQSLSKSFDPLIQQISKFHHLCSFPRMTSHLFVFSKVFVLLTRQIFNLGLVIQELFGLLFENFLRTVQCPMLLMYSSTQQVLIDICSISFRNPRSSTNMPFMQLSGYFPSHIKHLLHFFISLLNVSLEIISQGHKI